MWARCCYANENSNALNNILFILDAEKCRCSIVSNINYLSDYFISGVRKKVEDLCGCNDELIRPLNKKSEFGTRMNKNSTIQGMQVVHQNLRHQESLEAKINNQNEQTPQNDLKQKQSHSIWSLQDQRGNTKDSSQTLVKIINQ